jgi:hypothetical protein
MVMPEAARTVSSRNTSARTRYNMFITSIHTDFGRGSSKPAREAA